MSEWDGIEGLDGWSAKLSELLAEARSHATDEDLQPRLALSSRLTDFVVHSRPNTPPIRELDGIAGQAATGLVLAVLEDRVASIVARTAELATLTKTIEEAAASADEHASAIRLERIQESVERLTKLATRLAALPNAVEEAGSGDLGDSLKDVISRVQGLRNTLEGLL